MNFKTNERPLAGKRDGSVKYSRTPHSRSSNSPVVHVGEKKKKFNPSEGYKSPISRRPNKKTKQPRLIIYPAVNINSSEMFPFELRENLLSSHGDLT